MPWPTKRIKESIKLGLWFPKVRVHEGSAAGTSESSHLDRDQEAEKAHWEVLGVFRVSQSSPSDTLLATRPHLLLLLKHFHYWGPTLQIYEPIGTVLIQTSMFSSMD